MKITVAFLLAAAGVVHAGGLVSAPGPLREECVSSIREPEPRYTPPPTCKRVQRGSPTYHWLGREGLMVPSQQTTPVGTVCEPERGQVEHNGNTYALFAGGGKALYVICVPR